jgi:broad specificity phosphatase PhoE
VELILIRHAKPEAATVRRGRADPGLTELGQAQAKALAASPGLGPIDLIVQSPARRAIETARPLAQRLGLDPVTLPDLAEWDWGSEDYTPVEALREADDHRWQTLMRGELYGDVDTPAFRRRVLGVFGRLVAGALDDQRVAAICHGGVINAYLGDVIGMEALLWCHPRYASFSRVSVARDGRRTLISLNEMAHVVASEAIFS